MLSAMSERLAVRRLLGLGVLLTALVFPAGRSARAADAFTDSALKHVPADVSFFGTSLRLKEQLDAALNSKTYKKLMELPSVKKGLEQLWTEAKKDRQTAEFLKLLEDPENKEAVAVLSDAVSHEIFFYGGPGWTELITTVARANSASQLSPLEAMIDGSDPSKAQMRDLLRSLQKDREKLKIPELVFGFKVSDTKKAETQLKRIEKLAQAGIEHFPPLKGRLKRATLANGESVLTLQLDAEMIPWEDIKFQEFEDKAGEFDDLKKYLKTLKFTVTLGIKEGYLLLGFTAKPGDLDKLGGVGKKLGDHPDLKPAATHSTKKVASINYVSKALMASLQDENAFTDLVANGKRILGKADLPAPKKKAIAADLEEYADAMKKFQPKPSALSAITFLTDDGYETFEYSIGDHTHLKDLKLGAVEHLGGSPIFAAIGSIHVTGEGYDTFVKIVKAAYKHAEDILIDKIGAEAADEYKKASKEIFPLIQKLSDITSKMLLPSLKGGSVGFVMDGKWKSKDWLKALDKVLPKELPMPEFAFILGLNDSALFGKAMKEYRLTLNELYEKGRGLAPNKENIPAIKIPAPEVEEVKGGSIYFYPLPPIPGVEKQILPNACIGPSIAGFTLSKSHSERLLAKTALAARGPLATKKEVISVLYFDFPALVDLISPWVEVAPTLVPPESKEETTKITKELLVGLELLKVYRGSYSVTYLEGGVLVTHRQDLVSER
jgi:hypothetical protein